MKQSKRLIWKKFKKNRLAGSGLLLILITCVIALFAVPLSPDPSPDANSIHLPLAAKKPGFETWILKVPNGREKDGNLFRFFSGVQPDYEGIPVLSWRLEGDTLIYKEYYEEEALATEKRTTLEELGLRPSDLPGAVEKRTYYLGTDRFGRDLLSRMLLGARISLAVGFIAVLISMITGTFLGAFAAYFGSWPDRIIRWLMNVMWSLPTLLLVIAFSLALGKGLWQIFIAIGLSMWVDVARLVRGQVLSIREKEYVEAARVLGISDFRILFRHILPNLTGPLTVVAASNFASAILLEAGLSFLGLGVQAPAPSWGQMIKEHYGYIVLDSAYLAVIPGLAIMFMVMAFNFVGNGLRDALDIRLR